MNHSTGPCGTLPVPVATIKYNKEENMLGFFFYKDGVKLVKIVITHPRLDERLLSPAEIFRKRAKEERWEVI